MGRALYHGFVSLQARGVFALPTELRRRHGLDRPGAQMEITEREDGVLELRPQLAVPASQAWFWEETWQRREQEASADLTERRYSDHEDAESFLADLDA